MEHDIKCPRCDSSDTKFCYYNNYSLSQPRYFCKACRRYWTRGGTLRNVPVGGGCRKSKRPRPSASNPAGNPQPFPAGIISGQAMIRAPIGPPMGYDGVNHTSIHGGAFLSSFSGGGGGHYYQARSDLIFPSTPATPPWSLVAGGEEYYPVGLNSFDPNRAGLGPSH